MSDLRSPNAHSPNESASLTEWLDYMQQIHVSAIDMGLSRVLPVAEALGVVQSAKDDVYLLWQVPMAKALQLLSLPKCVKPQGTRRRYISRHILAPSMSVYVSMARWSATRR